MKKLLIAFTMLLSFWTVPWIQAQEQENFNQTIVSHELIFPLQSEHVHGSSFVELSNGDLLAVWFQGSGERTANDVRLMGARLKKGASQWSDVFPMADTPGIPDCNPVLFINRQGKLFLFWIAVLADRWEYSILRYRTSVDYENDGPPKWDWQDNILFKPTDDFAKEVESKIDGIAKPDGMTEDQFAEGKKLMLDKSQKLTERSIGWMTRIHPITLESGRILLPLYSDGFNFSLVAISDDDGETWLPSLPIVGLCIQPALAVRKNGDIIAYMRNSAGTPERIWSSISKDNGQTWSGGIRNDDKKAVASVELCVLQDGRWAYVACDTDKGRYRISLYISSDEGENWKRAEILAYDPDQKDGYSYPCMVQTRDGMLHITFSNHLGKERLRSIRHVCVDPAKIR